MAWLIHRDTAREQQLERIPSFVAGVADVVMLLMMIFVGLLASTLAQPPQTTEKPRNFFQQIGDIFKDTFGAFTVSAVVSRGG